MRFSYPRLLAVAGMACAGPFALSAQSPDGAGAGAIAAAGGPRLASPAAAAPPVGAQAEGHTAVPRTGPGSLPLGGEEFRAAMLRWSGAPAAPAVVREELALPVVRTRLSSSYGARRDPIDGTVRMHRGLDIPEAMGTPVGAAASGTVVFAGRSGGYGNLVRIDHGDGNETRYGHLSSLAVGVGDLLRQGQILGRVGSTGRSTGPHLHFEVRQHGIAVDPLTRMHAPIGTSIALAPQVPATIHWDGYWNRSTTGEALPQPRLK